MLKVVIDTNVLVSALLTPGGHSEAVVLLVRDEKITAFVSTAISDEYKEVLNRKKFKKLDSRKVGHFILSLKRQASFVNSKIILNAVRNDPSDNKFLECAVEAGVDFIVTGNKKNFSFKKFRGIRVVNPAEFIDIVLGELMMRNL